MNLPVKNLKQSIEFFTKLGYTFNQQFTDASATCMIISDDIFAMLLEHERFKTFTPKQICDATKSAEVFAGLSVKAAHKWMKWSARPSRRAEPLTTNRKTTGSCTRTDFRIWTATSGQVFDMSPGRSTRRNQLAEAKDD